MSDHGFATGWFDVARELLDAGLKESPDSRDAVPPHGGEAVGLRVEGHDAA